MTGTGELRVLLVGYGLAGESFHAPFIATQPGLRLAGIVTGDAERAGRARDAHPDARLLSSADDAWAQADAYDIAVIATPNASHVPLARAALDAGLHVVVDKPLAVRPDAARELITHADALGRQLSVYHNRRWDGDFKTVQALVQGGRLGRVLRFESHFERWRPQPKPGWRETGTPDEGAGLLLDLGSHLVDQALVLFGPVTHVYAELDVRRQAAQVEDDVFIALTHASGVRSHLWASALAAQGAPRFRVLGDRAAFVKRGMDPQEAQLRAGTSPDGPGWGTELPESWGLLGTPDFVRPIPTEPGDYGAFYAAFARAVRGEGPLPVDPRDALVGLQVLRAARQSAQQGETVHFST